MPFSPELVFPFDAVFLSSELGVFSLSAASKSVKWKTQKYISLVGYNYWKNQSLGKSSSATGPERLNFSRRVERNTRFSHLGGGESK